MSRKICARCGNNFDCMGEKDCWCESYQIHKAGMVEIMQNYSDCLCPGCLSLYAEK